MCIVYFKIDNLIPRWMSIRAKLMQNVLQIKPILYTISTLKFILNTHNFNKLIFTSRLILVRVNQ